MGIKSSLKQDSRTDRVEKHLIKHGTISKSQAEALGVWTKGTLATIIHRLRHTRHLNIVALDRREAQWNENKEQTYRLLEEGKSKSYLMLAPTKNPTEDEVAALIKSSKHRCVRKISNPETGDLWYWPAEQGTHAEGADFLNIAYDKAPGTGEVVILR